MRESSISAMCGDHLYHIHYDDRWCRQKWTDLVLECRKQVLAVFGRFDRAAASDGVEQVFSQRFDNRHPFDFRGILFL